jgi:diguanylate cyclase (GGDEF)-like protein/PAS domain S-box-containing protein
LKGLKNDTGYSPVRIALKISCVYILLGALWILLSDRMLAAAVHDKDTITIISIIKGWIFVLASGAVIYSLVYKSIKRIKRTQFEMEKSFEKLKALHAELAASEEFSKAVIDKMLNSFALHKIILDDEGKPCDYEYIDVNPSFEAFTGLKREDIIGRRYRELVPKSKNEKTDWVGIYGKVAETGEPVTIESYTDAFEKWVVVNAYSPMKGYFITVFNDISEIKRNETELRKKNEELTSLYEELTASEEELRQQFNELLYHQERSRVNEERFRLAAEGANGIVWDADIINNEYYISDQWYELLGYEKKENENPFDNFRQVIHPDDFKEAVKLVRMHLEGKTPFFNCECRLRTGNGEYKWFHSRGKALFNKDGKTVRFAGSIVDINDRKQNELELHKSHQKLELANEELCTAQKKLMEQYEELLGYQDRLKKIAYHDYLTELPNRLSLYEKLSDHLRDFPDENKALLFVDSDNFKFINDTMGHSFGDRLIAEIGKRLLSLFDEKQIVYRLGGDEFIIYCFGFNRIEDIVECAEMIMQSFDKPFEIEGSTMYTTVSIGIAVYPEDGKDVDELMRSADIAMYQAKSLGKSRYVFYSHEMHETVKERMTLERHLRGALQNNEFLLYYQPQLDIRTNKISGFEALLRWNNPELGFVPPSKFICIAEETHLIISIGEWVLRNACLFLKYLHVKGYTDLTVSVNISTLQFIQEDFIDTVMRILELVDMSPNYLELEITETVLMESYQAISHKLKRLKEIGVKIALDDFGQGYSSLSYLKQLPLDTLKIDKSFIDSINSKEDCLALAGIIVMIGRKMGLTILAEGVEKNEQIDYLKMHKCDKIQGYLISRPLPPQEAVRIYEEWH